MEEILTLTQALSKTKAGNFYLGRALIVREKITVSRKTIVMATKIYLLMSVELSTRICQKQRYEL